MAIDTMVFITGAPPRPTKEAKARKYTAKNSGEENFSAKLCTKPDSSVMVTTPTSAPKPADRKAKDKASVARPACAIG